MSVSYEKPTVISLHIHVLPEYERLFARWQAQFNSAIVTQPGFVSLEFLSPTEKQPRWIVVQRFENEECARQWSSSDGYSHLIAEGKGFVEKDGFYETMGKESDLYGAATEIFITEVNPEKDKDYREWSAKIHQAEATFPGFRGVYVQSPRMETGGHWVTLLQFDSAENLDRWLQSPERKALLDESTSLIHLMENRRMISPYIGWFASVVKEGVIPPVWKQSMLVLLVLFPIVMLEMKYLSPLLSGLHPAVAMFIGNFISVGLIAFPGMPIAIKCLNWWLVPQQENRRLWSILGTCVVLLLYLIEIAIFVNWK